MDDARGQTPNAQRPTSNSRSLRQGTSHLSSGPDTVEEINYHNRSAKHAATTLNLCLTSRMRNESIRSLETTATRRVTISKSGRQTTPEHGTSSSIGSRRCHLRSPGELDAPNVYNAVSSRGWRSAPRDLTCAQALPRKVTRLRQSGVRCSIE